jgi:hypothetical protein
MESGAPTPRSLYFRVSVRPTDPLRVSRPIPSRRARMPGRRVIRRIEVREFCIQRYVQV